MNKKCATSTLSYLFQIVTSVAIGLFLIACDSSDSAKNVSRKTNNGGGGDYQKPTPETGIVPTGHASLMLFSTREVARIFDIATNYKNSTYFNGICQEISGEKSGDTHETIILKSKGKRCDFLGIEEIKITRINNVITEITKADNGKDLGLSYQFVIGDRKKTALTGELKTDSLLIKEVKKNIYNFEFKGAIDFREKDIFTNGGDVEIIAAGQLVIQDNKIVGIKLTEASSVIYVKNEKEDLMVISELLIPSDAVAAPTKCGMPIGQYVLKQVDMNDKSTEYSPPLLVNELGQIRSGKSSRDFKPRSCNKGLADIEDLIKQSYQQLKFSLKSAARSAGKNNSAYGDGRRGTSGGPARRRSDNDVNSTANLNFIDGQSGAGRATGDAITGDDITGDMLLGDTIPSEADSNPE